MPEEYPAAMYHESGTHTTVPSAEAGKALGKGWTDKPADKHIEAIRKASGGVAEVIVPVTRTRVESI